MNEEEKKDIQIVIDEENKKETIIKSNILLDGFKKKLIEFGDINKKFKEILKEDSNCNFLETEKLLRLRMDYHLDSLFDDLKSIISLFEAFKNYCKKLSIEEEKETVEESPTIGKGHIIEKPIEDNKLKELIEEDLNKMDRYTQWISKKGLYVRMYPSKRSLIDESMKDKGEELKKKNIPKENGEKFLEKKE